LLSSTAGALFVVACLATSAANPGGSSSPKLYHLSASAPDQALTDTVYHYLSVRGAEAYAGHRFKDAEQLYASALEDAQKHHAKAKELAMLETNLASVYREEGLLDRAKPLFKAALNEAGGVSDQTVYRYVLNQYASFLSRSGQQEESRFTAEAARTGDKLVASPLDFRSQHGLFDRYRIPILSVSPRAPFSLPYRNPNDPYWDVSQPLPPSVSQAARPWSLRVHFAECPPRERWAAFDAEQKSALNQQWHLWLNKLRASLEDAIAKAVVTPDSGRYHLVISRFGHIDDVEILSNPSESDRLKQSISGAVSSVNTGATAPFPSQSQMDEIHVVLNFERPDQQPQEPQLPQLDPEELKGRTTIYTIAGGHWQHPAISPEHPRLGPGIQPGGRGHCGRGR
jgi:hypothetical protein